MSASWVEMGRPGLSKVSVSDEHLDGLISLIGALVYAKEQRRNGWQYWLRDQAVSS